MAWRSWYLLQGYCALYNSLPLLLTLTIPPLHPHPLTSIEFISKSQLTNRPALPIKYRTTMQLQTFLSTTLILLACTASRAIAVPLGAQLQAESQASLTLLTPKPESLKPNWVPAQVCSLDPNFPPEIYSLCLTLIAAHDQARSRTRHGACNRETWSQRRI